MFSNQNKLPSQHLVLYQYTPIYSLSLSLLLSLSYYSKSNNKEVGVVVGTPHQLIYDQGSRRQCSRQDTHATDATKSVRVRETDSVELWASFGGDRDDREFVSVSEIGDGCHEDEAFRRTFRGSKSSRWIPRGQGEW